MVQNIYAHKGEDAFFLNALKASLAPTPQEGTFHVMFVWKQHTQEPKPKVCDWNHLSLSVTVRAKPSSMHGRGLELTQPHFCGTDENVLNMKVRMLRK